MQGTEFSEMSVLVPDITASHPGRQRCSQSTPW